MNLEHQMQTIVGSLLVRAAYLEPASANPPEPQAGPGLDIAGVGVELGTAAGGVFSAVWKMEGYKEGLSFGPGEGRARHRRYSLQSVDVTSTAGWLPSIGRSISGVGIGWHVPNEDSPEAVWAVRLDFQGVSSVLIALGRPDGRGAIEYQPDEVVVVFDDDLARSYHIPGETRSPYDT